MLPAAFTLVAVVRMSLVLLSTSTQPPELMVVATTVRLSLLTTEVLQLPYQVQLL